MPTIAQHPQVISSPGEHRRTDTPLVHNRAQVVGDGDEQDVLRLWAQAVYGFK